MIAFSPRFAIVVLAAVVSVCVAVPGAVAAAGASAWSRPVGGSVVRSFDAPDTRFGPGHLGVDFSAAPDTPVRVAGDGVVTFAGRVGEGLHVVVRHPGGIRTSYSFLASAAVVVGQGVERGAVVGTSGGTGPAHGGGVLHFGVRVGSTYIDPMRLFTPLDLVAVVHLAAPHGGPAAQPEPEAAAARSIAERGALVDSLRVDARRVVPPPEWWGDTGGETTGELRRRSEPARARSSPATTSRPVEQAPRASPAATAAVAATGASLGGIVVVRRRRRDRRR